MAKAEYILEASWDGANIGMITFDHSVFDGPDTFGQSFSSRFDGEHDALTNFLKTVTWSRGRSGPYGAASPGQSTIVLRDSSQKLDGLDPGLHNPSNPDSPLAGKLKPLRPLRFRSVYGGVTRGCFYHFISSIEHDPDPAVRETTITGVDLFQWLGQAKPVLEANGYESTAQAIGRVLDAIFWTEPALRSLATGDHLPPWTADGTQTALDIILNTLLALDPAGIFFADADGRSVYKSRHTLMLADPSAAIAGTMSAARPGVTLDNIVNRVTVTRTGGADQVETNADSSYEYAIRDGNSIESALLIDDAQAAALGDDIVRVSGDPDDPMWDVVVKNGDEDRLLQLLELDLGDVVDVSEDGGGTTGRFVLQSLSHTVDQAATHTGSYGMSLQDDQAPIEFDTSVFDSADTFVY